jgi:hypothetical protein
MHGKVRAALARPHPSPSGHGLAQNQDSACSGHLGRRHRRSVVDISDRSRPLGRITSRRALPCLNSTLPQRSAQAASALRRELSGLAEVVCGCASQMS